MTPKEMQRLRELVERWRKDRDFIGSRDDVGLYWKGVLDRALKDVRDLEYLLNVLEAEIAEISTN